MINIKYWLYVEQRQFKPQHQLSNSLLKFMSLSFIVRSTIDVVVVIIVITFREVVIFI